MSKDLPGTPTIPVLSTDDKFIVTCQIVLPAMGKITCYR